MHPGNLGLHSRLIWRGSVRSGSPCSPFTVPCPDGLDFHLHSERVNLSLLTAISKEVQTVEGPMEVAVEARGNPHQPRVSGYVCCVPAP